MVLMPLVVVVLRGSLVLALSLLLLLTARKASASVRRYLLLLGFTGALAVPLATLPFPARPVVHVAAPTVALRVMAEALAPAGLSAQPRFPSTAAPAATPRSVLPWLPLAWALGALFVLLRAAISSARARRLVLRAAPWGGVLISAELESPVVVGTLRPVIVLPSGARTWSEERLRAVMLHESAHVRRRDGLALLVARSVCALYWFQPLAWAALRRLRRECELAADEDVLAAGMRATSYAEHLLAIARGMALPDAGIAMASRPSELARRIQALIMRDRLPAALTRGRAVLLGASAALVFGIIACTDGARPAPNLTARLPAGAPVAATDARLQAIADDEAKQVRTEWGAQRVAILVLDARSSALLASHDDAPGQPVVPASTLKPLTVAVALDAGLITPEQRFDCGNGTRAYGPDLLRDAGQYGSLDTSEILAVSSNIGTSRIFDVLGGERLVDGLRRFHVDSPASIPSGSMRGAIIAIGEGSTTSPLSLASAYAVFANEGLYTPPGSTRSERVIQAGTARSLLAMLEGVVTGEQATGKAAQVTGVRVGGKTGTSDDPDCESCAHAPGVFASFVGIVPIDHPRWVIYVGVGEPKREGSGGTIAAPAFARIASRALAVGP